MNARQLGFFCLAALGAACSSSTVPDATPPDEPGDTGPITSTPAIPPAGLKTASTHPMQYYVSLPKNWSTARQWPVVVTIAGSGREWTDNHAAFTGARDASSYPFIIVTPLTITNTGGNARNLGGYFYSNATWDRIERENRCTFDFDGIRAAVADVAANYKGTSTFFITGFSGGGHTQAAFTLLHPDWLRGASPAAGNWSGRCVTGRTESPIDDPVPHPISTASARVNLPIRTFNGTADDPTFSIPQRDSLVALLRRSGYTNVSSQMVPNVGHDPMAAQVLAFFASTLGASER
jgi:poly(3-hydroxybutyrate) depolymerase